MKPVLKLSICALALASLAACNKGGGNNGPTAAPYVNPQSVYGPNAVCNPTNPSMLNTPGSPCNVNGNPMNPNGQMGPMGAMGSVDIIDPGNGTTILRNRQFHLLRGYGRESGTDSCYTNPDTGDNSYSQSTRPIGTSAMQSTDLILSFDPNGILTLSVTSPLGQVQSVAPASYTLDASSSSILIQGYQGSVLQLSGVPNPNYSNRESINAYHTAQASDQFMRDNYNMPDNVSSVYSVGGAFGPIGPNGGVTFDPHYHLGQPMPGQPMVNGINPAQPMVPGQPVPGQPVPGQPMNGALPQNVPNYTATLANANPLANGMNSLSMTISSGIIGHVVVSPTNPQHVIAIYISSMDYTGASVISLPNTTCQSQSSGQFMRLEMR